MHQLEVISVKMLQLYLNRSDTLIIDLRSREEYYQGHLPGAVSIPYDPEGELNNLPQDKIIILVCARGSASLAAAKKLARNGYNVKSVSGGIMACKKGGLM